MNFWENLYHFITRNITPEQYKFEISICTVVIYSILVYLISWIVFAVRKVDMLKLEKYGFITLFLWVSGATLLQTILISTQIINFNIVSFLFVAMIWDNLYVKLYKKASEKNLLEETDSIDKKD